MFSSDKWFGATPSFYNGVITSSLRFDNGSDTYLYDVIDSTPSSTTQTTVSFWVKRASIGDHIIFCGYTSAPNVAHYINFDSTDKLVIYLDKTAGGSDETNWNSGDMVFRDTTNWYHIAVQYDLGQSSNTDKVKVYVNGTQITLTASQTGSAVTAHRLLDSGIRQRWGNYFNSGADLDGYLAEVNVIDGQVVSQNSFGETKNGVWIAKEYSGTYGNNGYRLQFKQTGDGQSTASASTIGADTSSNNHHFQDFNFDTHDSNMPDSPENNFAVFNKAEPSSVTLSEGNLLATVSSGFKLQRSTFFVSSGKWYWEILSKDGGNGYIGASTLDEALSSRGAETNLSAMLVTSDGDIRKNASESSYGNSVSDGDIIGVALDMDNGKIYFSENGTYYNSGNPASSTNPATTGLTSPLSPSVSLYDNEDYIANFGQDSSFAGEKTAQGNKDANNQGDFYYAPPSGYLALCSSNLPDTTLSPNQEEQADDHFNTVLYTGNETDDTAITGVGFKPDWIWVKNRSSGDYHRLYDSSRGVQTSLASNASDTEVSSDGGVKSFDSDGFTLGSTSYANRNSGSYVAWNWKVNGGTTSSDTNGSRTSTVQANTIAGIAIATYTNTSQGNHSFGHGLGTTPDMFIWRARNTAMNFIVYHKDKDSSPASTGLYLNSTTGGFNAGSNWLTGLTSTTVSITDGLVSSGSNINYWCISFKSIEGYSKFGSYVGNGSADGTFIYTGFRPAWVMIKQTNGTGSWVMHDNKRSPSNVIDEDLFANLSSAESDNGLDKDFLSNGFKHRASHSAVNGSGSTYIYMAFAKQPFHLSNAR